MAKRVIPVARSIYVCDYHYSSERYKHDLYGVFNAIRATSFPHVQEKFCLFAQLTNGLGRVPFFFDVRHAETRELVHITETRILEFPDRNTLIYMVVSVEACRFPRDGLYLIELFCDNTWVGDTTLLVLAE